MERVAIHLTRHVGGRRIAVDACFTKPVLGQDVGPDDLEQDSRQVERHFASLCRFMTGWEIVRCQELDS